MIYIGDSSTGPLVSRLLRPERRVFPLPESSAVHHCQVPHLMFDKEQNRWRTESLYDLSHYTALRWSCISIAFAQHPGNFCTLLQIFQPMRSFMSIPSC
ncbi:hypothetical protein SSCG_06012 [Streptomyces clavuligerus]|nr:hypothetical protein SSCG_06012 [Streptomyces clavuligerus]